VSEQNPTFDVPPPQAPAAPPAQPAPQPPLAPPPQPPSQPAFGAPPQPPQGTFGTAPGGFEQVGSAPGVDQTIGTAPPQKKGPLRAVLFGVGGVVVLVVVALIGLGILFNRNSAENAKVGDCLPSAATDNSSDDASTLRTVDCTSAEAETKVVGIVEGLNRAEFDAADNPCTQYATAESALWIGKTGRDGTTFCLEPVRPS